MRFSIIIPVYNGAHTLGRCLDSILRQTFQDYQVVIVNDGAVDRTEEAAAGYIRQDPRFHLLTIPHSGTGAARNRGMDQARGEYVLYMDADDYWTREDLLLLLDRCIREHPTDVLMFQAAKVTEGGRVLQRYAKPLFQNADTVLELHSVYADLVRDGHTLASACNKCVRRALLLAANIRYREDIIGEDIDWVLQLFSHVQTIRLLNLKAYAYTQHREASRSTRADAPNDLVSIVHHWAQRCTRDDLPHTEAVAGLVAFEYGICMGSYHRLSKDKRRLMREHTCLLDHGMDRKTTLILRFYKVFGFSITCLAIRVYLLLRRIW